MSLQFNGQDLPSYIKINDIALSVLPPIKRTSIEVSGRSGVYDFGNTFNERTITVNFTILASDEADLRTKAREFASWLYTDEFAKLVVLSEPDKHYMAKVNGNTNLTEILNIGQGSITFVAEPFLYGEEKIFNFNPTEEYGVILVDNKGDLDTYPQIHLEFTEPTTSFAIGTADEVMIFGTPEGVSDVAKDINPLVLHDDMTDTVGWTSATSVDGGVVYGSFESVGQSFIQKRVEVDGVLKPDYGVAPNFHGASAIKSLPKPVKDFTVKTKLSIKASKATQVGRIEVYLLDANGSKIGKIAMVDNSKSQEANKAEARVGNYYGNHHYFVNSYGQWTGFFNNFNSGIMEIERKGDKWRAYFALLDKNEKHYNTWETYFVDVDKIATAELAQIQIHIGAYGTYEPIQTMQIHDLKVYSHDVPTEREVPIIFKVGDTLDIDAESGMILKNGEPFYSSFDPSSTFIKLEKGVNGLSVMPTITKNGTIKFRERWL